MPTTPPLPSGQFVRVERYGDNFRIVTTGPGGGPVGPRLDRGKGIYPACATSGSLADMDRAMRAWDAFCEMNRRTK